MLDDCQCCGLLSAGGGRLLMLGPQAEKARLPNWVRVRFMTAALVCDDLSWRQWESAVLNATRSTRYETTDIDYVEYGASYTYNMQTTRKSLSCWWKRAAIPEFITLSFRHKIVVTNHLDVRWWQSSLRRTLNSIDSMAHPMSNRRK